MKKTIKLLVIMTLVGSLIIGITPAAAKTTATATKKTSSSKLTKDNLKKTEDAEARLIQHSAEYGLIKSTTPDKFKGGELATFEWTAKVIANADANSGTLKTNHDDEIMSASDAMAITRGVIFEACLEKPKKASEYLKTFSNGLYEKFDEKEYVTKKWLYAMINAYKNGTPTPKDGYSKEYSGIYDDWYPIRGNGKGVTKVEVLHIVYNSFVRTFYK